MMKLVLVKPAPFYLEVYNLSGLSLDLHFAGNITHVRYYDRHVELSVGDTGFITIYYKDKEVYHATIDEEWLSDYRMTFILYQDKYGGSVFYEGLLSKWNAIKAYFGGNYTKTGKNIYEYRGITLILKDNYYWDNSKYFAAVFEHKDYGLLVVLGETRGDLIELVKDVTGVDLEQLTSDDE